MENEDKKGFYTKIPNEVMEALTGINLSSYQVRILFCILRKTCGWGKEADAISLTQFVKATGIARRHVGRTLSFLEDRNIIKVFREGSVNCYSVNTDTRTWKPEGGTSRGTSTCKGTTLVPNEVLQLVPVEVPTKENKESLQKKKRSPLIEGKIEEVRICYQKNIKKIRIWDDRRKAMIAARLKEWNAGELKKAILGVAGSDWHMKNAQNSLEQIFKNDRQVEKYLDMYNKKIKQEGNDPQWL